MGQRTAGWWIALRTCTIEFYSICISGATGGVAREPIVNFLSEGLGGLGIQGSYGNSRFVGKCVHLDLKSMKDREIYERQRNLHLILAPSIQMNVFLRKRGFHLGAVPKKSPGDIGKRGTLNLDVEEIAWWMQARKASVDCITPIDVVHTHDPRFAQTHPEVEFDKLTQNHVDLVIQHTLGACMRESAARFIRRHTMWLSK